MTIFDHKHWRQLRAAILAFVVDRPRKHRQFVAVSSDGLLCIAAVLVAFSLRLGVWDLISMPILTFTAIALALWYPIAWHTGVYRSLIRYSGARTVADLAIACSLMTLPLSIILVVFRIHDVPRTLGVLHPIIFLLLLASSRIFVRFALLDLLKVVNVNARRVLVYGAGRAGQQLALSLRHEPQVHLVGFVDDDLRLAGQRLDGVPVFGSARLDKLLDDTPVDEVLLAIPSASRTRRREIIETLQDEGIYVRSLPNLTNVIDGSITVNDLREIQIEELLGRETVAANELLMGKTIVGKTVMVSGAGGSIGSELCRQIVRCRPTRLILLEQSEYALYAIEQELGELMIELGIDVPLTPELANVSERSSMTRIYRHYRPDTVFHAAAYKHVPLVEANPLSGLRNNIMGTLHSVEAAEAAGVANFILISTDKAVRPTNIMGASKRVCELILQARAEQPGAKTVFSMVRFGNVLGSSGSVVPRFKAQIAAGGPVTVTDREITRYFMTIPEAAQLVIQASAMAKGGEVFVLDMGQPVKIIDLARTMIRLSGLSIRDDENPDGDIQIVETGLRPGEKLYEELLIGDNPQSTNHPRIMRAREILWPWPELEQALAELDGTIRQSGDADTAVRIIGRLVPEYAPENAGKISA
ncbi:capsule biosynthesis protein CapD [Sphingopyxis sp. H050]|jgi:FlaA1/EpsC-like NDP-sugar epimerase|uniref:polysaccharide biosynthesis protein n=1 Tax=Sphingopyxis sp. H050 TaxID=1759072 RepID=UPI0007370A09|nr:nucleoside-diphosphate sugar epimerase/dehydratase [Sphingopyxis sp. H050]KTE19247.1 capsule biosynthesis protein CapD [Sphingopyxis sp. H050]